MHTICYVLLRHTSGLYANDSSKTGSQRSSSNSHNTSSSSRGEVKGQLRGMLAKERLVRQALTVPQMQRYTLHYTTMLQRTLSLSALPIKQAHVYMVYESLCMLR
jgi:hypothetical protein